MKHEDYESAYHLVKNEPDHYMGVFINKQLHFHFQNVLVISNKIYNYLQFMYTFTPSYNCYIHILQIYEILQVLFLKIGYKS